MVAAFCHDGMVDRRKRGEIWRKARNRDAFAYEANLLDETNLRLLQELRADGRVGMAELGRRIGMSPPAVAERVQRLERAGDDYRLSSRARPGGARIPGLRSRPRKSGRRGQLQRIPEIARETAEVGECYRITGEDCYLLRFHCSIDELEDVLDRFTPYGRTTASIIHSMPVPRRGPPIERHICGKVMVMEGVSVGRAASRSGWSARMLRYVEQAGLVVPARSPSGYRLYEAFAI